MLPLAAIRRGAVSANVCGTNDPVVENDVDARSADCVPGPCIAPALLGPVPALTDRVLDRLVDGVAIAIVQLLGLFGQRLGEELSGQPIHIMRLEQLTELGDDQAPEERFRAREDMIAQVL